ncbi:hypothetical protein MMC07_002568 [Pseudocyphellaria aurata]|nr:hypothetical protein [Pseudocyphellaria aurata]
MHRLTFLAGLVALATSFGMVSSFGFVTRCHGSVICNLAAWSNDTPESIVEILRDAVWASTKDNSTVYNSGDHIICVGANQPITIGAGAGYKGVSGTFSLSGDIPEGGICLFPQGSALTLGQIRPLTNSVLEHGCSTCGSVPIHYVDQGSNDPGAGLLTFNYVHNPTCDGNCISATGGTTPSRVRRGNGSYAVRAIHA